MEEGAEQSTLEGRQDQKQETGREDGNNDKLGWN